MEDANKTHIQNTVRRNTGSIGKDKLRWKLHLQYAKFINIA